MGGLQAVVFLLVNKKGGKEEMSRLQEASKQREVAMENIMGRDSFYRTQSVDTELIWLLMLSIT